jgi:hypothetical protein
MACPAFRPAFRFFSTIRCGRSHSRETLRTYAEHLHYWFDSLEQSGFVWREANEEMVAAYRNLIAAPRPQDLHQG